MIQEVNMNAAEQLFNTLESFNEPDGAGQTAEQRLLAYCTDTLGAVERIHFDFKEKQDRRNAQLEESDKKNLAKAVSGFANSAGGVIIWGIVDTNLALKPIAAIEQFTAKLLELAPAAADPRVQGIDGRSIRSDADPTAGYSILHIPESTLPPHRVILNIAEVKNHYYIRSGSAFSVAPHVQLEDMFGRRPHPNLALHYRSRLDGANSAGQPQFLIILGIENRGRGSARAPYLALKVSPPYHISGWGIDGNGNFGLTEFPVAGDLGERKFGGRVEPIIHPGDIHEVAVIRVEVNLRAEMTPDFVVDYRIAAEGIMPVQDQLLIIGDELRAIAQERQTGQNR